MFGSAAIRFSGIAVTQFWWALFLLGVGWNFMFIGGTTLVVGAEKIVRACLGDGQLGLPVVRPHG